MIWGFGGVLVHITRHNAMTLEQTTCAVARTAGITWQASFSGPLAKGASPSTVPTRIISY
eukprot:4777103-Amphidinium_carterae.1